MKRTLADIDVTPAQGFLQSLRSHSRLHGGPFPQQIGRVHSRRNRMVSGNGQGLIDSMKSQVCDWHFRQYGRPKKDHRIIFALAEQGFEARRSCQKRLGRGVSGAVSCGSTLGRTLRRFSRVIYYGPSQRHFEDEITDLDAYLGLIWLRGWLLPYAPQIHGHFKSSLCVSSLLDPIIPCQF